MKLKTALEIRTSRNKGNGPFLSHQAVCTLLKQITKVRIIFDDSAQTSIKKNLDNPIAETACNDQDLAGNLLRLGKWALKFYATSRRPIAN